VVVKTWLAGKSPVEFDVFLLKRHIFIWNFQARALMIITRGYGFSCRKPGRIIPSISPSLGLLWITNLHNMIQWAMSTPNAVDPVECPTSPTPKHPASPSSAASHYINHYH
jgi:hypothetical protein